MGYAHIPNLYRERTILLFKQCYASEKVHGSSAHVGFKADRTQPLTFFSGGESLERFVALFDQDKLLAALAELALPEVTIFGEVYGGKCQGMRETYGPNLAFIAFDVKVGESWLVQTQAEEVATKLGFEFVPYRLISTDLAELNAERDAESIVAIRRGMGPGKKREGVVLRPLIEVRKNDGDRVCAKHKAECFSETKSPRQVSDKDLELLSDCRAIAEEWVTENRLSHVLQKIGGEVRIERTSEVIRAMIEDVEREGAGEIVTGKTTRGAIAKNTAQMFKHRLQSQLQP